MSTMGALGRTYQDGEIVFSQGDVGDCLYVVQEGHLEIVKLLLKKGAKRDVRDNTGKTALDFAKERDHKEIAALLKP